SVTRNPSRWQYSASFFSRRGRVWATYQASVLITNSVGICGNGFLVQTRRERRAYPSAVFKERTTKSEPKRHAARRVAPHLAFGFVAPRSQIAADMLPRRAAPKAKCGATNAHPICEQHTSSATDARMRRTWVVLSRCASARSAHLDTTTGTQPSGCRGV